MIWAHEVGFKYNFRVSRGRSRSNLRFKSGLEGRNQRFKERKWVKKGQKVGFGAREAVSLGFLVSGPFSGFSGISRGQGVLILECTTAHRQVHS